MFFSYFASVVMVSLALYGLWHIVRDIWNAYLAPRWDHAPRASLLMVVQNVEQQVEGMIRFLIRDIAADPAWCDIVVVDYGSEDITPSILDRLARECPLLKVVHLAGCSRPVSVGITFCQGEVVYVLDFVHRLKYDQFMTAMGTLTRKA